MRRTWRWSGLALLIAIAVQCGAEGDAAGSTAGQDGWLSAGNGLDYRVLRGGRGGNPPRYDDKVWVNYTIRLLSGEKLLASPPDKPEAKIVGRWFNGFEKALRMMSPGAHYEFKMPAALGRVGRAGGVYGIPPGKSLHLDLELVEVTRIPPFRPLRPKYKVDYEHGIQYEVVKEGHGEPAQLQDTVAYHLIHWSEDGQIIQCTYWNEQPRNYQLARERVPGLRLMLPMMKPGSRWFLKLPAGQNLAPGETPPPQLQGDEPSYMLVDVRRVVRALPVPDFVMPSADGLQQTGSGLQYQIVKQGDGARPRLDQSIVVHYAGWLTDGVLFDSSFRKGQPSKMALSGVIPGWQEGLTLMNAGAIYRFVIPPELAYGEAGRPPVIGPNETLVFFVELRAIE